MASGTLTEQELDEIYAFAVQLGKDAGKLLLDAAQSRFNGNGQAAQEFAEKDSAIDIVTKTDEGEQNNTSRAVLTQEALTNPPVTRRRSLHQDIHLPEIPKPRVGPPTPSTSAQTSPSLTSAPPPGPSFLGEESYSESHSSPTSRPYLISPTTPTWCVDPLDGTVNYTHLFPMFCVSIAFLEAGRPAVGVVHAPSLGQLFTACRGRGAWLNESQRLPLVPRLPMPADAPGGCIFACEWGKDRRDGPDGNLHRKVDSFLNMAAEVGGRGGKGGMVHGVRSLGR